MRGKKLTVVDERCLKLAEESVYAELAFVMNTEKEAIKEIVLKKLKFV